MTTVLVLVLVVLFVVVLAAALPALDRYCAALAERKAGEFLSLPFGAPTTVEVTGRPFLTQALRGRYDSVRVEGRGVRIGEMAGATLDARLHNVYLSARDLLGRRTSELPVERVEGQLLLPYAEVARAARVPGLQLRPSRGRVIATATLPVPGISQLAPISGMAVLELGRGNTVWLRVRGVSVAGINVPTMVLQQLLPALDVPIGLPPLPYGLQLDEVRPGADGLVVLGSAAAVVFRGIAGAPAESLPEPGAPTSSRRPSPLPRPTQRDGRPGR